MTDLRLYTERLAQLVALPSVSATQAEFDMSNLAVCERLAEWFAAAGFRVEVRPIAGWPGKYNFMAARGSGPGGLLFAGHTDTVPYDQYGWDSDPFVLHRDGDRLRGLGATDMKGFFPAVLAAAERFRERELARPLLVLGTADEESSMCGARALVAAGTPLGRYAVIGEPTGLRPKRLHKGIIMESLQVVGQSGHSSDPSYGNNAIEAMHEMLGELLRLRGEFQQRYHNPAFSVPVPTLNFGCIHGGDNPNRICGACELQYDLRPLPGMQIQELRGEIAARLAPLAERLKVRLVHSQLFPGIEPFEESADAELVKLSEELTGHRADSVGFGTEAPFFKALGAETLILGPGAIAAAHQPNEYIELAQVGPAVELYSGLIERLCLD